MDLKTYLNEKRELVDLYLKSYFKLPSSPRVLHEAIRYSVFAGGKRIRPILALASYEACGGDPKDIISQASALELIHTYSLIHDDLPAMDDDDLRRGKPTSHKVFGEALAILAGDALLTEAFCMISDSCESPGDRTLRPASGKMKNKSRFRISHSAIINVIREVSLAAGAHGMVGGQAQDILSENTEPDRDILEFIHIHKTAALITASVRMGPILANAGKSRLKALTKYGENIGLAFQIIDDILDVEGTTEILGKTAGSDTNRKKLTYPSLFGVEIARQKAGDLIMSGINALKIFNSAADPLRGIASYLRERKA
jgi:geranylgeranyl diphosphate synthase type II